MRLQYQYYEKPVVDTQTVNFLVIESPDTFLDFNSHLFSSMEGEESYFVLSNRGKEINFAKSTHWVKSIWSMDLNARTYLTAMLKNIEQSVRENNRSANLLNKWYELQDIVSDISNMETVDIDMNDDIDVPYILKSLGLRFSDASDEPLQRLINFLLVLKDYTRTDLVIMAQCISGFSKSDLKYLVEFCENEEVHILFVEPILTDTIRQMERRTLVVDEDWCEILLFEP